MPSGENPNSRANLKSWEPGQSGNPAGRPKGSKNVKPQLEKFLGQLALMFRAEIDYENGKNLDAYDGIIVKTIMQALAGDKYARDFIFDRLEGKPRQAIDLIDRKPDELEGLSQKELKEEAKALIEEINGRINPENEEIEEDQETNSD